MGEEKLLKDNLLAKWLDGRLNEEEQQEIDASGELKDLKAVIDDIDTWKVKPFDVEAGLSDLKNRKKQVIQPDVKLPKKNNYKRWLSLAASVLLLLTAGYFSWNYFVTAPTTITTAVAETEIINLPDASQIKLDAVSSISRSNAPSLPKSEDTWI